MGLDCTHGFWNGSYGAFMRWREWLAAQVGLPLRLMESFYGWEWEEGDLTFDRDYLRLTDRSIPPKVGQMHWDTLLAMRPLGGPIQWFSVNDPLVPLLHHSDCNGRLRWWDCKPVGLRLLQVIRQADDDFKVPIYTGGLKAGEPMWTRWQDGRSIHDGMVPATKRAARGCLRAYQERVDIKFR